MMINELDYPLVGKDWNRLDSHVQSDLVHYRKNWSAEEKADAMRISYEETIELQRLFETRANQALLLQLSKKIVDRAENMPLDLNSLLDEMEKPPAKTSALLKRKLKANKVPYRDVEAIFKMLSADYKEVDNE